MNVASVTFTGITVNSPPVVSFAVRDSAGKPVTGLTRIPARLRRALRQLQQRLHLQRDLRHRQVRRRQLAEPDFAPALCERSPGMPYSAIEGTTDPKPTAAYTDPEHRAHRPEHPHRGQPGRGQRSTPTTSPPIVTTPLLLADAVDKRTYRWARSDQRQHLAVKDGKTLHRVALQLCYVDPVSKRRSSSIPTWTSRSAPMAPGFPSRTARAILPPRDKCRRPGILQ